MDISEYLSHVSRVSPDSWQQSLTAIHCLKRATVRIFQEEILLK